MKVKWEQQDSKITTLIRKFNFTDFQESSYQGIFFNSQEQIKFPPRLWGKKRVLNLWFIAFFLIQSDVESGKSCNEILQLSFPSSWLYFVLKISDLFASNPELQCLSSQSCKDKTACSGNYNVGLLKVSAPTVQCLPPGKTRRKTETFHSQTCTGSAVLTKVTICLLSLEQVSITAGTHG